MSKQKQKFDQILTSYFSEDYEKTLQEISALSEVEQEFFWSYANSRIVVRQDSINLAKLYFAAITE